MLVPIGANRPHRRRFDMAIGLVLPVPMARPEVGWRSRRARNRIALDGQMKKSVALARARTVSRQRKAARRRLTEIENATGQAILSDEPFCLRR